MYEYYDPSDMWQPEPKNKREERELFRFGCMTIICYAIIFLAFMAVASLCGCSPKVIENTIVQHDTTYVERVRRDSVFVLDSIYIKEWQKGDTVYISRDKWHTQWRDRLVRDTSYVAVHDTIHATEIKEVEKRLSTWQSAQIWAGRLMIALLFGALLYVAWKIYLKFTGRT